MAGNLVPDIRTDCTGRTQRRWVRPGRDQAPPLLPPPVASRAAGRTDHRPALYLRLLHEVEELRTKEQQETFDDDYADFSDGDLSPDELPSQDELAERVVSLPDGTAERALAKVDDGDRDYTMALLLALSRDHDAYMIDALTRFSHDAADLYQGDEEGILSDPLENSYTVVTSFVEGLSRDYMGAGYRLPADISAAGDEEVELMKVLHWLRERYSGAAGGVPDEVARAFIAHPGKAMDVFLRMEAAGDHSPAYVTALLGETPALADGAL